MNAVVLMSFISAAAFIASGLLLMKRRDRVHLSNGALYPLLFAILLYASIAISNLAEHAGISNYFDPLEDISEIVFTFTFLVVLLDMIMPEMDGLEVFERLRQIDAAVKVVMTSGFSKKDNIPEGVKGFINKPFTYHELLANIAKGQG